MNQNDKPFLSEGKSEYEIHFSRLHWPLSRMYPGFMG